MSETQLMSAWAKLFSFGLRWKHNDPNLDFKTELNMSQAIST